MQNFTRSFYSGNSVDAAGSVRETRNLRLTPRAETLRRITDYSKALEVIKAKGCEADVILN